MVSHLAKACFNLRAKRTRLLRGEKRLCANSAVKWPRGERNLIKPPHESGLSFVLAASARRRHFFSILLKTAQLAVTRAARA
jgi:hypothetical protein